VRNPIYSTSVGLLLYGLQKQAAGGTGTVGSFSEEPKTPVLDRLKRWVQGNF
jgi:cell division protein FtsA